MVLRIRNILKGIVTAIAVIWLSGTASAATHAIIFASDYGSSKSIAKLANASFDGRLVYEAFLKAGVTDVQLVLDADADVWEKELRSLLARTGSKDTVIFYYAGHGLQVAGANYFVAADGETLIGVDPVISLLASHVEATVMIIDACRNNPFRTPDEVALKIDPAIGGSRSLPLLSIGEVRKAPRGLAQLSELRGMSAMVLFSTEPGNVAADGEAGKGSPFATVVARELVRRASLNTVIRRISLAVNKVTGGQQSPWRQGDLPFDVYVAGMPNFPAP
ncbi:MAG: caspase family protein [Sphingomonadaceae bacterium]